MKPTIVIIGDQISDVYINTKNIQQNQEITDKTSIKGYYDTVNVYPGGTGFFIDTFLKSINDRDSYKITYLLPDFNFVNYTNEGFYAFNVNELFDRSIKYIYNNRYCDNFNIIKMQPIDYISDIIKPTVKVRFYSKDKKEVFYRFDMDNDVQLKNINCSNLFNKRIGGINNLILIDYDKGYLNKYSIKTLFDYIDETGTIVKNLFLNTKPHKIKYYKKLITLLKEKFDCCITIQLNEFEYEPIKTELSEYNWDNLIITRGTKPIQLHIKNNDIDIIEDINIKKSIILDIPTTSGCGDMLLSGIIYSYLYKGYDILESVKSSVSEMKQNIIDLNNKLFGY